MNPADFAVRLADVQDRIEAARARAGRTDDVTIVAVTKTHPPEAVRVATGAGLLDVGENRVQELMDKAQSVDAAEVRWHLIGHLQRNKAKRALPVISLLHSLDSLRLAREIDRHTAGGPPARALVQVNVSGEGAKGGFAPEEAVEAVGGMTELSGVRIEGMMTMAPFDAPESVLRRTFAGMRELSAEVARQVPGYRPLHLSMGMSGDYEIAVEEGSTMVRLGTVLFGDRER